MSAFGGKADMTLRGNPLSRSLLGVKRTCRFALHMSAYDPKRTYLLLVSLGATNGTARQALGWFDAAAGGLWITGSCHS